MVVQVYITKKLRLIQTETTLFKPISWEMENPVDTLAVFRPIGFKHTYEIFGSTWNSVSNIYYVSLNRQIALNAEIDAFIGSFKRI